MPRYTHKLWRVLGLIAIIAVVLFLIQTFIAEPVMVVSKSMDDTILDGRIVMRF